MNWKNLERTAARKLGGERVWRGDNFYQSAPDVEHPGLSIECKYRKALPKWLVEAMEQAKGYDAQKIPVVVLKERYQRGEYVLLQLDDFVSIWEAGTDDV